jgi:hypothetical protein
MNRQPQTTSATIELEAGTEAPTGALTDGQGQARRFSGWIELAAAIEDWRTSTARDDSREVIRSAPAPAGEAHDREGRARGRSARRQRAGAAAASATPSRSKLDAGS